MSDLGATVEITCLCGRTRDILRLKTSLPASSVICHCDTCRWSSGTLFQTVIPLLDKPTTTQTLSRYNSSAKKSRYFCDTCGTHVFHHAPENDLWSIPSGVVDRVVGSEQVSSCRLQQIAAHQFVDDTGDGGLAVCLTTSAHGSTHIDMQSVGSVPLDSPSRRRSAGVQAAVDAQSRLPAACHCGGVQFFLSRPTEQSRLCSSPWPDLLRPYHSYDPANPQDEKWWLRGSEKYFAGTCACRTCRLSTSSPITCWAFIPHPNLSKADRSPFVLNQGTLRSYESSEGRTRGFCSICGAAIFLRIDERPQLLDISLGLFRAPEGSRAETWFEWCTSRVSFAEDAVDKDFIARCEAGLKCLD